MPTASVTSDDFSTRLDRLRQAGLIRVDLTDPDPARCGLGWTRAALDALLDEAGRAAADPEKALAAAREAVESYLAGHRVSVPPDRIFFATSRSAARALALSDAAGGEVLVPAPARALPELAGAGGITARAYALAFGEEWRLDRRSLPRAVSPRTSAIVVGNPAEPTGALLAPDELEALDELCGVRGLALVGDESFLDTALGSSVSVARATRALSFHVSGLGGVCGLPALGTEWVAVGGPEALAAPAAARLRASAEHRARVPVATLAALPTLLARRGTFLEALRARLARNRGAIAAGSLREAPWTLQWGGGGWWAVLQVNASRDETELCAELLDEGIAIQPGHLDGLPASGHLVVSLLPEPHLFDAALERLEEHLRGRG
jgi:aspartate/methionine/tyrosine aminotransferase